jgi:cytochrome c oxidase cbb3-type subunit 4
MLRAADKAKIDNSRGWSLAFSLVRHEAVHMDLTIYHFILIAAFIGIVIWAFSRKRKARFEKDAKIPFDDRER